MGTEAQNGESTSSELNKVAREEREFVQRTLKEKLGREPSEGEVNEWLREHTESY
jgi:hypothetical protein